MYRQYFCGRISPMLLLKIPSIFRLFNNSAQIHRISTQVLKVDEGNPIKRMRQNIVFGHLLKEKYDPILHICEWQRQGNL